MTTTQVANAAFVLCPGQGAQHVGMGQSWAQSYPTAVATFEEADQCLGFALSEICFTGPEQQLCRTDIAQVAIYTTSVACYRVLLETGQITGPSAAAGLSLGEFTALHLGGAFDFASGLRLVHLRGQAMQDAAEDTESSMVAITGNSDPEQIEQLCAQARGNGVLVPANFNSPMQVVISGSTDACVRAVAEADQMGLKATALTVAGAFHSPLMQPAADRLATALDTIDWQLPRIPILSNVTAKPHHQDEGGIESIKCHLIEQLTHPVQWSQSMQAAAQQYPGRFIELAPGKVLSGLMRRIDRKTKVENFAEPPPAEPGGNPKTTQPAPAQWLV